MTTINLKCKNDLRSLTRSLRRMFEKKLANNSKNNPKPFWPYVKSKLKTRTKIPNLTKADGSKVCTSKEKVDVLNAYFGNVYKKKTGELPQHKYYSGIPLTSNSNNTRNGVRKIEFLETRKIYGFRWLASILSS